MFSETIQETSDIDWFMCDSHGNILHVASAGGRIPDWVSEESNNLLNNFFSKLPALENNKALFDSSIFAENEIKYFKHFEKYALRGIYSFDKVKLGDFSDTRYRLVAAPIVKLNVRQLPLEVRTTLIRSVLQQSVEHVKLFDVFQLFNNKPLQ